jgi:hypothetical protein
MDLIELQKRRRRRGVAAIVVAMFLLVNAISTAIDRGVPMPAFLLIYSSGVPLGAGIAIVVASYGILREIGKS